MSISQDVVAQNTRFTGSLSNRHLTGRARNTNLVREGHSSHWLSSATTTPVGHSRCFRTRTGHHCGSQQQRRVPISHGTIRSLLDTTTQSSSEVPVVPLSYLCTQSRIYFKAVLSLTPSHLLSGQSTGRRGSRSQLHQQPFHISSECFSASFDPRPILSNGD